MGVFDDFGQPARSGELSIEFGIAVKHRSRFGQPPSSHERDRGRRSRPFAREIHGGDLRFRPLAVSFLQLRACRADTLGMATAATAVRACVPVAGRASSCPSRSRRATRVVPRASHDDEAPMDVPEDAFRDGQGHPVTPERKAALALGNLFTMAATRVILDQFTGTRHRSPVYYKMVRAVRGPDVAPPPPNPRAPLAPDLEPRKNPLPPTSHAPDFFLPRPRPARARARETGGLPERKPAEERQRVARQAHARAR